jgi:uncharacterized membrane protein SpoIIM required for sporulation
MNAQRWIASRVAKWQELEALLQRVESKGVKSLNANEIGNLASLYRSVAADLARAQTNQFSPTVIQELQALTSRAYSQVYRGSNRQELANFLHFYAWDLPQILRDTWVYTAISTALCVAGGLLAWWFTRQDPDFIALIAPPELLEKVRDRRELWMGSILGSEPLAASGIMINNMVVAFRTAAGGITAGIFTLYALFSNGIMVGALATYVAQYGLAYPFWAFVFPHGSLEIPAICLAGAAGLLIARGLVWPGQYRRRDALKIYGLQAAQLMMAIVPMLFVAGLIEGFFSPQEVIPGAVKYLTGSVIFVAFILYCLRRPSDLKKQSLLGSLPAEKL